MSLDLNALAGMFSDETIDTPVVQEAEPQEWSREALQPGGYAFVIPEDLSSLKIEPIENGTRLQVTFIGRSSLRLKDDASKSMLVRLTNKERTIYVKDDNGNRVPMNVSDLAQLLGNAFGERPTKNMEFITAIQKHAGKSFKARVTWSTNCSENRDIYGQDAKPVTGKRGCGRKYRENSFTTKTGVAYLAIPKKSDGKFAEKFACPCGAVLRVFPNLGNFAPDSNAPRGKDSEVKPLE